MPEPKIPKCALIKKGYALKRTLGAGGQGEVELWVIKGERVAIKLVKIPKSE